MGWNGSGQTGKAVASSEKVPNLNRHYKVVVAILVAIALPVVVYVICIGTQDGHTEKPTEYPQNAIKVVKQPIPQHANADTNRAPVCMRTVKVPITGELKHVPYIEPKINSNNVSYIGRPIEGNIVNPPKRLFKHRSLGMLAALVSAKPGAIIVGIELPRNFDADIADAIRNEQITADPDDTPQEAETRELVKEMLEDCKRIIAEGGSVREAVMKERDYLRKVGEIRMTLQKEVSRMRRDGASEADIADAVDAANRIMEEYGGTRIRISPFRNPLKEAKE